MERGKEEKEKKRREKRKERRDPRKVRNANLRYRHQREKSCSNVLDRILFHVVRQTPLWDSHRCLISDLTLELVENVNLFWALLGHTAVAEGRLRTGKAQT